MKRELFKKSSELLSLTSPHFDDERTLLSARAVVPLARVESRSRLRRGLTLLGTAILGGTVTAAILLQFGRIGINNPVATQTSAETTLSASNSPLANNNEASAVTK